MTPAEHAALARVRDAVHLVTGGTWWDDHGGTMRVYVSGPMSGIPGFNLDAFAEAAIQLTEWGYDAVNPGRHGVTPGYEWDDYLRRALTELLTCDGVAMLPNWTESRGARLEVYVTRILGMPNKPLREWGEL